MQDIRIQANVMPQRLKPKREEVKQRDYNIDVVSNKIMVAVTLPYDMV